MGRDGGKVYDDEDREQAYINWEMAWDVNNDDGDKGITKNFFMGI